MLARRKWLDAFGIGRHPEGVDIRIHDSLDEFCAIAEPLYGRDPVVNTIELTLLRGGGFPDDSLFLSVWDGESPVGAALQTPPYPLACNGIPSDANRLVATELARRRPSLSGVRGEREQAMAFADAWRTATGRPGTVTTEERLYRLGTLRPPIGVPGAQRDATSADRAGLRRLGGALLRRDVQPSTGRFGRRAVHRQSQRRGRQVRALGRRRHAGEHGDAACARGRGRRASGRSSPRAVHADVATAPPSPPRQRTWHGAEVSTTSCCSPTWPTRHPTPSTNASASKPWVIRCGSTSLRES